MYRQVCRVASIPIAVWMLLAGVPSDGPLQAMQATTVGEVLEIAGAYVQQYERAISAVVSQEDYQQVVLPPPDSPGQGLASRKTRAYLLVIDMGRPGWVAFRDVFEVDGRPVRERIDRMSRLLSQVTPDSLEQARRIAIESARFNLNPNGVKVDRTINTPMTALLFLRAANQSRSVFRTGKTERIDGQPCVTLTFTEQATPRVIWSNDGAAAAGTFWIDAAKGTVMRTELRLSSWNGRQASVRTQITVKYAHVPSADLWLPASMDESYEVRPSRQQINGHAQYSDFRQFKVTTGEITK